MKPMLTQLRPYMFTKDLVLSTYSVVSNERQNKPLNKVLTPTSDRFVPNFDDTLFWCFYIMYFSMSDYEQVSNSGFKEEKDFKIKFVELIRKNTATIKSCRIPRATLENEMVNNKKISLIGFKALCFYYNVAALVVHGKMFVEMIPSHAEKTFIISVNKGKYGIVTSSSVDVYRTKLIKVNSFDKPMRAISSYKLSDLVSMAKKLDVSLEGATRKPQLYSKIMAALT